MTGEYLLDALSVPASLDELHELLATVASDHPDVDSADLMMLETAVIEIAGNVVEHGRPEGAVAYRLRVEVRPEVLRAELSDRGSVEVAWPPDPADALTDPLAESGRGLHLAKASLDRLDYTRHGDRNLWIMERRRA